MVEMYIPNILGTMSQADQMAAQTNETRRQNALADFYKANGTGIMNGDQNALNALAGIDMNAAMQVQGQRQQMQARELDMESARLGMESTRQQMGYRQQDQDQKAREYAAGLSTAQREAEALEIENGVKTMMAAQTPQQWDALAQQIGRPELAGQFEGRQALAAQYMGWADLMKGNGGSFRPATGDEAGAYGSQAGQFGPDGRFYPINPPSGLAIETGPDGQVRVVQGAGAGGAAGKPFTEAQSKDNVFATRAEGALAILDPVADALTSRMDRAAEAAPFGLARGLQSDEFQSANQAGNEFLQAILRKDTGAAITEPEQALYGAVYLPQPGDGDAVLAQKAQSRRRAVEALQSGMSAQQIEAMTRALQASGSAGVGDAPQGQPDQAQQPVRRRYNPQTGEFE